MTVLNPPLVTMTTLYYLNMSKKASYLFLYEAVNDVVPEHLTLHHTIQIIQYTRKQLFRKSENMFLRTVINISHNLLI
jgi:hypothetical protein